MGVIDMKQITYLNNEDEDGGYCENGHWNCIPACTEIFVGNSLRCLDCNTLIFEVVEDE